MTFHRAFLFVAAVLAAAGAAAQAPETIRV
jgi:hypothetical protein